MWPIVGEVVVRVALVEEPRKPISEGAYVPGKICRMNLQGPQELDQPIFDQPQDARFEGLSRPAFRHVPTHRQPVGELALGFLIAAFTAPTNRTNIERAASTAHGGRSVHTVPAFRFTGLVE
jgi:hypothetical protein